MRISCTHCQQEVNLDDSKLPFGLFKVKCPRCTKLITVNRAELPDDPVAETGKDPSSAGVDPEVIRYVQEEIARLKEQINRISGTKSIGEFKSGSLLAADPLEESLEERRALVCTDDPQVSVALAGVLRAQGYIVDLASTTADIFKKLESATYQIITLDSSFPDDKDGVRKIIGRINGWKAIQRRKTFLALVSSHVKTADPNAGFFHAVNLTVSKTDVGNFDALLRDGLNYYRNLYRNIERLMLERDQTSIASGRL